MVIIIIIANSTPLTVFQYSPFNGLNSENRWKDNYKKKLQSPK